MMRTIDERVGQTRLVPTTPPGVQTGICGHLPTVTESTAKVDDQNKANSVHEDGQARSTIRGPKTLRKKIELTIGHLRSAGPQRTGLICAHVAYAGHA